jgi:hypothetical protein
MDIVEDDNNTSDSLLVQKEDQVDSFIFDQESAKINR